MPIGIQTNNRQWTETKSSNSKKFVDQDDRIFAMEVHHPNDCKKSSNDTNQHITKEGNYSKKFFNSKTPPISDSCLVTENNDTTINKIPHQGNSQN